MSYKRIGDYIHLVDISNTELAVTQLLGISIQKKFILSIANISTTDMSVYRIIKQNQFAYSPVTSRNGDKITIALLKDYDEAILSPAYQVFEVVDEKELIPEYLFLWFNRAEFDRYARFHSWGSARETFNWEDLCDVKIPIPHIDEQKKYVAIYNNLLKNQQVYENSLADLQLICDQILNKIKHAKRNRIGQLVTTIDKRNKGNKISNLKGINVNKTFMSSVANVSETDLSKYKIIKKSQFAYSPMQVGRDETIRVALYNYEQPAIISPAYLVFEVINDDVALPEFLMLWFCRSEFNRYGWFLSDGSVRASLEWERFSEIEIPIPDIEVQKAIVTIYHTLETRKRINGKLKDMIKPLCPVLMRGVVENTKLERRMYAKD